MKVVHIVGKSEKDKQSNSNPHVEHAIESNASEKFLFL